MNMRIGLAVLVLVVGSAVVGSAVVGSATGLSIAAGAEIAAADFFETKIRPVLVQRCYECHSANSTPPKGGLRLDTAAGWLTGGDSGPAVVPGKPRESLLLSALRFEGLEMPPSGQLPATVIGDFETWILQGAPAPGTGGRDPIPGAASHAAPQAGELWSFHPPRPWPTPVVADTGWPRTWIDHFVAARLAAQGLSPIEDTDPGALLRRLSFDLIGLPPAEDDVWRLHASPADFSVSGYVQRLLDSPQFGEHWGRHWLDIARYADSNGGDFNATFHDAWRYRNYVIDSLNHDRPYDQFIVEQIAGDLLPAGSAADRERQVVATGFLMLGAKMLSERDKTKLEMDVVDEQLSAVGTAFLGMTLGCARCHDHKFDPVSTVDYYALAGIFKSTRTLEGEIQKYVSNWVRQPLPISREHAAALERHTAEVAEVQKQLAAAEKLLKEISGKAASDDTSGRQSAEAAVEDLRRRLKDLQGRAPPPAPLALAVQDARQPVDCHVCIRGEAHQLGSRVPRGIPSGMAYGPGPEFTDRHSGRLELARWIADPRHPLTARVYVNRVWNHLMGRGLVASVDNFGRLGQPPTHPELLDRLAVEFTRHGWSTKWLVREIVTSRVYQLSSRSDPARESVDPENLLWWRAPRKRLSAEAIRDTLLSATGELDRRVAGSPVSELGVLVTQNRADDAGYAPSSSNLRTIYQPVIRNELPSLMRVFDFADPDFSAGDRPQTTVPAQALWMLNGPLVRAKAAVLAESLAPGAPAAGGGTKDRIETLYVRALGRRPDATELRIAEAFIAANVADANSPAERLAVWTDLAHALFASSAFRMAD